VENIFHVICTLKNSYSLIKVFKNRNRNGFLDRQVESSERNFFSENWGSRRLAKVTRVAFSLWGSLLSGNKKRYHKIHTTGLVLRNKRGKFVPVQICCSHMHKFFCLYRVVSGRPLQCTLLLNGAEVELGSPLSGVATFKWPQFFDVTFGGCLILGG